ncbi:MAG: hypothetical protein AAF497_22395 [Planctomycetota bacterium]
MRWRLLHLLLLVTLIAVYLGWRFGDRHQYITTAKRVNSLGGQVAYCWQSPVQKPRTITVYPYYTVLYKRTDASGNETVRTPGYTVHVPISRDSIHLTQNQPPGPKLPWPKLSELTIDTVVLPQDAVEEDILKSLQRIKSLKSLVIIENEKSLRTYASTTLRMSTMHETAKEEYHDLAKQLKQKVDLAKELLPGVDTSVGFGLDSAM